MLSPVIRKTLCCERMIDLSEIIAQRGFLLLDGALGTLLWDRGEMLDPLLWSAGHVETNPECLVGLHRDYLRAGADILTAATYQLTYEGFQRSMGYSVSQTNAVIQKAVSLAREAVRRERERDRDRDADSMHSRTDSATRGLGLVAASIGCYGAHLCDGSEYRGSYGLTADQLCHWHTQHFDGFARSRADLVGFETVPCLAEAKAILRVLDGSEHSVQAWLSVACSSSTRMNCDVEDSVEAFARAVEDYECDDGQHTNSFSPLEGEGHFAPVNSRANNGNRARLMVGVNCTEPTHVEGILHILRDTCRKSRLLIAYPNRGDGWDMEKKRYVHPTHDVESEFRESVVRWYEAGASVLGGCCKTSPSLIKIMCEALTAHVNQTKRIDKFS